MCSREAQPAAIATWRFGEAAVEAAGKALDGGGGALDAVECGINAVELDPNVNSVGYGGLPNVEGVVELDAAIMDGATHRAGCVAALRGIRRPISVARKVMEETRHVMLVGEGALKFALSQGFPEEDLLTPESRMHSEQQVREHTPQHDTVGLIALDAAGNLAVGCSTSGLAGKMPGRVGDSPIIGSGLYVDNQVGAATATGRGEEIMKSCASFLVVEFMRSGLAPEAACQQVIARILARSPQDRNMQIGLIAMSRSGACGAASTVSPFPYAVWRRPGTRILEV
jgi:L-asparaginase/N4-(beta-N-acetylglucosaminyl)-L-asparaginase